MNALQAELISESIESEISGTIWECDFTERDDGSCIVIILAQSERDSMVVDSEIMSKIGRAIEDFDAELAVSTQNILLSLTRSEDRVCMFVR